MNTKLTLNLDTEVINEAKTYAKSQKVSLSKLIENYLNKTTPSSPVGNTFTRKFLLLEDFSVAESLATTVRAWFTQ
jgi:hypothetical protein